MVLEKKILKFCQCIFLISLLSPLKKSVALHLNKLEYLLHPKRCFAKFGLNWLSGLQKIKSKKFIDRQTDNRRSEKQTWAVISGQKKITLVHKFRLNKLINSCLISPEWNLSAVCQKKSVYFYFFSKNTAKMFLMNDSVFIQEEIKEIYRLSELCINLKKMDICLHNYWVISIKVKKPSFAIGFFKMKSRDLSLVRTISKKI